MTAKGREGSGEKKDKGENNEVGRDPREESGDKPRGEGDERKQDLGPVETMEIEVLKKELIDREEKNRELTDNIKRLQAEFENYRKRMVREQTRILETAEADLVKKLLEAIDNLERALESAESGHDYDALRDGVGLTLNQLFEILGKEGLETIDPHGEAFDPNFHEAVLSVSHDDYDEGTVSDVLQKGYIFRGRLLRPAKVEVAGP